MRLPPRRPATNTLMNKFNKSFLQNSLEFNLPDTALYVWNTTTRPMAVHMFAGMKIREMAANGANVAHRVTIAMAAAISRASNTILSCEGRELTTYSEHIGGLACGTRFFPNQGPSSATQIVFLRHG